MFVGLLAMGVMASIPLSGHCFCLIRNGHLSGREGLEEACVGLFLPFWSRKSSAGSLS